LTQYRLVTDRRTDTLRSLLPALAWRRAGKNVPLILKYTAKAEDYYESFWTKHVRSTVYDNIVGNRHNDKIA